MFVRSVSH
jgi:3-methylcrotonyl-CoA carboxylase beta subunit